MNYDKALVSKIIESSDIRLFADLKHLVTVEMIQGPSRDVYRFINEHFSKYKEIPTFTVVQTALSIDANYSVESREFKIEFIADEIANRFVHETLASKFPEIGRLMDKGRGFEVLEKLQQIYNDVTKKSVLSDVREVFSLGEKMLDLYDQSKTGYTGIISQWKFMNEVTWGFQPEDLALIVARPGVGKTWALILLAMEAWRNGKKVLFIEPEISNTTVLARFMSAHLKLSYGDFRRGRLGEWQEKRLREEMKALMETGKNFKVVGQEFCSNFNSIDRGILKEDPDIVFVDALYMINRTDSEMRLDKNVRIGNIVDGLKGSAKRFQKPIVASSQLSRKASHKSRKDVSDDALAFTDVTNMDADYVIAMVQDKDMRRAKEMEFQFLKVREGEKPDPQTVRWDFQEMDFVEIGTSTGAAYGVGDKEEIPF